MKQDIKKKTNLGSNYEGVWYVWKSIWAEFTHIFKWEHDGRDDSSNKDDYSKDTEESLAFCEVHLPEETWK